LILVHEGYDEENPNPLDVFTLDAGTGERTLLGTLPEGWGPNWLNGYDFQWGADRKHVLAINHEGAWQTLVDPTDAARDLAFVCCAPAREVLPNGEGTQALGAAGWVLSPESDQVAGLKSLPIDVPGCPQCTQSVPGAIVILDAVGGDLRTLALPEGTQLMGPISWSPDGSAVVVAGCRPCNNAGIWPGANLMPTDKLTPFPAVEHAHLFVVPVNGSPVQELLDEAETKFFSAAWSPDGTTIAFVSHECPPDEHSPDCFEGTVTLETLGMADGQRTAVLQGTATVPDGFPIIFVWSPDSQRFAMTDGSSIFVMDADGSRRAGVTDASGSEPTWSPDGKWLLYSSYDEALGTSSGPWIVAANGGEPRLLGSYGGWAW
jgi:WD40 repeat protein